MAFLDTMKQLRPLKHDFCLLHHIVRLKYTINNPLYYDSQNRINMWGVSSVRPRAIDIQQVLTSGAFSVFVSADRYPHASPTISRRRPQSAGAHPGPLCYRKSGHLALTDANVFLGRVIPRYFPKIFGPGEVGHRKERWAIGRRGGS